MKKILITFLLIYSVFAKAQKEASGIQFSDSTAIGVPDGKSTSKQIGATGGTIVSDDGKVELIFPAGATTANTTISIQPTTNLAPNGVGKSYWFEPSGIQFKKPVQIIFHYTDEEAEICPPDWMSLGIQSKTGKWSFVDYESFDSISKTLKGYIHHFSGATNINDIMIKPEKWPIMVNSKTLVEMIDITGRDSSYPGGYRPGLLDRSNPVFWYANEVLHGNNLTGKITQQTASLGKEKVTVAEYKAPSILPKYNPVKIWAEVYRRTRKGKILRKRLSTSIQVYDMYKISISQKGEMEGDARLGDGELNDSASCLVYVYHDKTYVDEDSIKNYPPEVTKEGGYVGGGIGNNAYKAKLKIHVNGAQGFLHLTKKIIHQTVSKDHPPEVYFVMVQEKEVVLCHIEYIVRNLRGPVTPMIYKPPSIEINFIANGRPHTIEKIIPTPLSDKIWYTVRVKRYTGSE